MNVHYNANKFNFYFIANIIYINPAATYAIIFPSLRLPLEICFFFIYPASAVAIKWLNQASFYFLYF